MALEKILKNSSGVPTGEYERISGGTLYADTPVGVIQSFGGSAIPTGWLLCDGAEVLKTDYVELYAVIGDAFGTASVNTKFVLPDLREATTKGAGETGKTVGAHVKSGGLAVGEFLDDRVQEHSHTFGSADNQVGLSDYSAYYKGTALSTGTGNKFNTGSNSGRTGATTEVKSVGVNYIIKAKQVALPADLESAVEDAVEVANEWKLLVDLPRATTSGTVQVTIPDDINEMLVEMYTVDSEDRRQVFGTFITQTVKNTGDNPILQFYAYDNVATTYKRQANCNLGNVAGKYSFWMDTNGNLSVKVYYR